MIANGVVSVNYSSAVSSFYAKLSPCIEGVQQNGQNLLILK
jgi:hypothetical protein